MQSPDGSQSNVAQRDMMVFWMPNSYAVPLKEFVLKQNDNSVDDAGFKESYHVLEAHIYEIKLILATYSLFILIYKIKK
jgi:hypothetical protein